MDNASVKIIAGVSKAESQLGQLGQLGDPKKEEARSEEE